MSEENLAVVQQFADRVNQQDIPGFLALVDPEVEFHTLGGVQRGLEGARRFAEGGGPQEHYLTHIMRCLKRYIAREVYPHLTSPPPTACPK